MILLIDISADNQPSLDAKIEKIKTITLQRDGEYFVAKSLNKRKIFWKDRANTAAIATHTNAFKINEDVVIPLDKLANYNDGIERINIPVHSHNAKMLHKAESVVDEIMLLASSLGGV